ncbi:hypothetical protein M885DRAFT_3238 [Pelagophyceae sp. CCMP2097]|nr:hypothetical protein M885DRAFT_3238 [Pelagophyceae sp. CCMP2097]
MPWRLALRIGAACLALQAPPRDFARTQIRRHSSVADAENAVEELFVRNVHHTTSENELRDAFSLACADACVVCDVAIPRCRTTGRGRGFAFVTITRQPGGSWPSGFHIANRHLLVERNRDRGGVGASIALNAKIADAQNADAVFDLHEKEGGLFSATNFATAMHRLGRPGAVALDPLNAPRRSEKAKRLVKAVVASIAKDRWDARGLTNALPTSSRRFQTSRRRASPSLRRSTSQTSPGRRRGPRCESILAWGALRQVAFRWGHPNRFIPEFAGADLGRRGAVSFGRGATCHGGRRGHSLA